MPLPTFNSVVPKEAWGSVRNLVTDLLRLEDLRKSASLSAWDNVGWSTEKRLAILRSITKFLSSMMTASILNRPRQRRVLLSLSSTWRERAALGEYFSSQSKQLELQPYCRVLHAFRYDCLLEAALAAYDTGLVIPLDERESWWWIALVASARLAACPSQTWHARWAKVWTCIGTAMQLVSAEQKRDPADDQLLTITPLATSGKTSKPRFDLRYKHARKSLYLPNGLKVKSGLTPEYRDWIRDQDTLELREVCLDLETDLTSAQAGESINDAAAQLQIALESLELMLRGSEMDTELDVSYIFGGPGLMSKSVIQGLRTAVVQNCRALSSGRLPKWDSRSRDEGRSRWIVLLQE
ncbi:hypothetical protein CI109_104777 [Kwoniella shandongensis]|uniref:Uncharacterized protein n=1 Tax=Kwoniella shandongensis TaxID=1734106 RepID=A0AAJ8LNA4_9TREE